MVLTRLNLGDLSVSGVRKSARLFAPIDTMELVSDLANNQAKHSTPVSQEQSS